MKRTTGKTNWTDEYKQALAIAYKEARQHMPLARLESVSRGWQTVCYRFNTDNVIRISRLSAEYNVWLPEYGKRSFDCPVLQSGIIESDKGSVLWQIAPKARILTANSEALERFQDTIRAQGYELTDFRANQVGIVKGVLKLTDYECAIRIGR